MLNSAQVVNNKIKAYLKIQTRRTELTMKDKFINFYMKTAYNVAQLSYCKRKQVGAVIVDKTGKNIISYGYNGTPSGTDNCCEDEELVTKHNVIHAEANAITKLATSTQSSEDGFLFVTLAPCATCAGLIIQSGIKTVFYSEEYRCDKLKEMFKHSNIKLIKYSL